MIDPKSFNDFTLENSMSDSFTQWTNDSLQLPHSTSMLENSPNSTNDTSELPHSECRKMPSSKFAQFFKLNSWPLHLDTNIKTASHEKPLEGKSSDIDPSSVLDLLQRAIEICLHTACEDHEYDLLMRDFGTVEVIHFRKSGPNFAKRNFDFHVYAPAAFRFFRQLFGITTERFLTSLCEAPLAVSNANGKSGSKFYTTMDSRFIIKTVNRKDIDFLINLLPGYYLNLTQRRNTFLPKYFGLYSYVRGHKQIRYLVMNNLLPPNISCHEKYDLKGATYYRRKISYTENDNYERNANVAHCKLRGVSITFKDLDFREKWPFGFYLKQKVYKMLMSSIEKDCKVLESYEIMNYSLLLFIHIPDQNSQTFRKNSKISSVGSVAFPENLVSSKLSEEFILNTTGPFEACSMRGERVFLYMGIIDILQSYHWRKKLEHSYKAILFSSSIISVNKPKFYSERFQNFLKQHVFKCIPEWLLIKDKKLPARRQQRKNK
ncbi:phosphatidylinositol 4-phosphate 5-kinase type-1 alpha-like [Stegodyphus dumicola]|uniref:phosphatidylinositol 4-phosphate 5-kinase type-1 alpha-like n=1 Tax=Stegodyphus dumicola TaxID=202533 RepID=UPI0015AAC7E2|nr:phosphatidylinositol 4-phosphate 5-kinase type-1 alpha-like [Stegodyphus dumicola]